MKYKVTAMSIERFFPNRESNKYKVKEINKEVGGKEMKHPQLYRDEVIDTKTNTLFKSCRNAYDVEDVYEAFWNRLNDDYWGFDDELVDRYTNTNIVKVLKVVTMSGGKYQ